MTPPSFPDDVDATRVPPLDRLTSLTDEEIYALIDWWQTQNYVGVSAQFWIDELSRRRTEAVLARIVSAVARNADVAEEVAGLTAQAADENRKAANINVEMARLTRETTRLARAGIVIAMVSLIVAVIALFVETGRLPI